MAHPCDATSLTPRGGNRRSFPPRSRPPFPPPLSRPYPRPRRGRRCVRLCPSPRIRELCRVGCRFQASGMPEYPGTPPAPLSLSGTTGPVACGESGMAGSLSGRHSVRANGPGPSHEGEPRTSGPAVPSCPGDPGGGAGNWSQQSAGVSGRGRNASRETRRCRNWTGS